MLDNIPTRDRKIVDLRVDFDDDETMLLNVVPTPASMSKCALRSCLSSIGMFNWKVRNWVPHLKTKRRCSTASNDALATLVVEAWELREQRQWRSEQYETEFIIAVQHILLHLHPRQPLVTLTIGSNLIIYDLPRLCSAWLSRTPKLESLKIHYQRARDGNGSIMRVTPDGINTSSPTSLQYLDLTGVYYRWTLCHPEARGYVAKKDQIYDIARLAPSLVYLRLNIGAVLIENLPLSDWLFDDVQGASERSASLPRTVKMVFFQYELQKNEASGSELRWYRSCEDSLRSLAVHEPRFKVVDFCDRALSLEQLVDRLE